MRTAAELDAGTLVGGYRIEAVVARGGMGVVYRATQLALDRAVALKLIAPEFAQEEGFRARFEREAKLAAALEHPHVLPVHEAGAVEGLLFLSMRYVEGRDLGALLAAEGPLPPARAAAIVAQVAAALDAAHARGLVHRDVKPQNVLVERRGEGEHAYLCDFGLSRVASASALTATGGFLGTVDYAAPEQIRGEPVDARSDVYALGCLLFQALTGRVPYPQEDELAKLWAHLHEPPPAPSALHPELEAFDPVVARAVAKEPDQRYQGAGDLARAALAAAEGKAEPTPPRPRTLPRPATPLVGRRRELAELGALLARPEVRLLTLTGAGGSGKTRLALALAEQALADFPDGAFFVELAPIADPALVLPTVAQALELREAGGEPLLERLKGLLRERELLLCLDNVEQVVEAAPELAELLAACPALTLLVTSRERLHLQAEHEYPVEPLALPDLAALPDPEALAQVEAVALFLERAQAVKPDFRLTEKNAPAVAAICRRLDGLPLALELAAARFKLLSPEAMLARLEHALELLTGGARDLPARQQTLRGTIEWSHELLTDKQKRLFPRLAVFVGGCTLEAAERVCEVELDTLALFVDKSLLREHAHPWGEPRFAMLETVREYALEKLEESGEADEMRRRHAEYYLGLAVQAEPEIWGPRQEAWLERLESEHDNLRAALSWTIVSVEAESALRLAGALEPFWEARGHISEGRRWLAEGLATAPAAPATVRAKALFGASRLARIHGEHVYEQELLEESVALNRKGGDQRGLIFSLAHLGTVCFWQGDQDRGRTLLEESVGLARELGDKWSLGMALNNLGCTLMEQGDYARARQLIEESLRLRREIGEKRGVAITASSLGELALAEGDGARAMPVLEEALALARDLGHLPFIASFLAELGLARVYARDYERARPLFEESLERCQDVGDKETASLCLSGLAALVAAQGHALRSARLWGAAAALREETGMSLSPPERPLAELCVAPAQALDQDVWREAETAGREMTLDQAVAYALEEEPVPPSPHTGSSR